jgi:hypothetical protein
LNSNANGSVFGKSRYKYFDNHLIQKNIKVYKLAECHKKLRISLSDRCQSITLDKNKRTAGEEAIANLFK